MAKKSKYKVHLITSSPKSACGIIYPIAQSQFLKYVDCKRCLVSHEYEREKRIEGFMEKR